MRPAMAVRLFWLLACTFLLLASREPPWADARIMADTARAIVERGSLELRPDADRFFYLFHGGKAYGLYPLGNVITLIPGIVVWKALRALAGAYVSPNLVYAFTSHVSPSVAAAAACALFFLLARREGTSARVAAFLALALGTTTILAVYARVAYSEALQAALLLWVVHRCLLAEQAPTAANGAVLGFAAGWLLNVKAVNLLPLLVVAAYLSVRLRGDRRQLLRVAAGAAALVVPWVVVMLVNNHIKTGAFLDTGYSTAGRVSTPFSGKVYDAVFGFLLSPGKGIFLFSPPLLLGLMAFSSYWRERRAHALLIAGIILAIFVPHVMFHSWYGGWCWGPRYLVPITPLLLLPAGPWLERALASARTRAQAWWRKGSLGALLASGLAVQVLGCSFYWDFYTRIVLQIRGPVSETLAYTSTVFQPKMSPIVGHAWLLRHALTGDRNLDGDLPFLAEMGGKVKDMDYLWSDFFADFWLLEWIKAGPVARSCGLALVVLLLAGVTVAAIAVVRGLRREAVGTAPTLVASY